VFSIGPEYIDVSVAASLARRVCAEQAPPDQSVCPSPPPSLSTGNASPTSAEYQLACQSPEVTSLADAVATVSAVLRLSMTVLPLCFYIAQIRKVKRSSRNEIKSDK